MGLRSNPSNNRTTSGGIGQGRVPLPPPSALDPDFHEGQGGQEGREGTEADTGDGGWRVGVVHAVWWGHWRRSCSSDEL